MFKCSWVCVYIHKYSFHFKSTTLWDSGSVCMCVVGVGGG